MNTNSKWIVTRWYCIRHAVVPQPTQQYILYGDDVDCIPDTDLAKWHGEILPSDNTVFITSDIKRTTQTAESILKYRSDLPIPEKHAVFNEMDLGDWIGDPLSDHVSDTHTSFWFTDPHYRIPNGESFADTYARVSAGMLDFTLKNAGKNIISVTHTGTIRAMIVYAMQLPINTADILHIDNQSVTLLEHFHSEDAQGNIIQQGRWRIHYINKIPTKGVFE